MVVYGWLFTVTDDEACPNGYVMAMGKCYRAFANKVTRAQAEVACGKIGDNGRLIRPTTELHVS